MVRKAAAQGAAGSHHVTAIAADPQANVDLFAPCLAAAPSLTRGS